MGFWILAAVSLIAAHRPLVGMARRGSAVYLSTCFVLAILLIWGLGPALLVQVLANVVAAVSARMPPRAVLLLVTRHVAALLAAGLVLLAGVGPIRQVQHFTVEVVVSLLLAIVAWLAVNYAILAAVHRRGRPQVWSDTRRFRVDALASASVLLLAPLLVTEPRRWAFALLLPPVVALQYLVRLLERQRRSLRTDALTGTLNLRGLAEASSEDERGALLLVSTRRLRAASAPFGAALTARLLRELAGRLEAVAGEGELVGRLDATEFVVYLSGVSDLGAAVARAEKISAALAYPAVVDGIPFSIGGPVAVAVAPPDAVEMGQLIGDAHQAAQEATADQPVAVYEPAPVTAAEQRLALLRDFSDALAGRPEAGVVEFRYQPQVSLTTRRMVSVEALLQWRHPRRGRVDPQELLDVVEPTELMAVFTNQAVSAVVRQLREWREQGVQLSAAVNVSMGDLHGPDLPDHTMAALATEGVPAELLTIEVTEGQLISSAPTVRATVARLRAAGIGLAVDDFGSGFTSLQHLRQLPLTELKIDKALVQSLFDNSEDLALVRTILDLATALRLRVVAEGIEDEATHRLLAELGCPVGQGWYYARSLPADEITRRFLATRPFELNSAVVPGQPGG